VDRQPYGGGQAGGQGRRGDVPGRSALAVPRPETSRGNAVFGIVPHGLTGKPTEIPQRTAAGRAGDTNGERLRRD
jgi:hypothetical protein